ncbi:MAG: AAA family ATPase [Candidatus Paceibacterota bacterium]
MQHHTNSLKNHRVTAGDKINAILNFGSFAKSFHILKRNLIPNKFSLEYIDPIKWNTWISEVEQNYEWLPENRIKWLENYWIENSEEHYFLHLENGITLAINHESLTAELFYDHLSDQQTVQKFITELEGLQKKRTKFEIGFIQSHLRGLNIKFRTFTPYEKDLTSFLGDDIISLKNEMIDAIGEKEESGLFLLHGEPGTGKTSFIKTVLSKVSKRAIYLTPGFADKLASPDLIGVLMDHPGSILVIEDAETVLMKRQADNSNAVSNLLNLTDGFPADFLKLNIICTFNTGLNTIDPALLREGRLKGIQEFKKLNIQQATNLANHLGKETTITKPMTLAEICNAPLDDSKFKVNGIGF